MVADMLSQEGSVLFTGENDPVLVGDALPFALKLYEALLETDPENSQLLLATGKAYCLYAYAYIQNPAELLPDEEYEKQERELKRAERMYNRAKGYLETALAMENSAFFSAYINNSVQEAFQYCDAQDIPYLYWTAAAGMGAFSTNPFDMAQLLAAPKYVDILKKVIELDESFDKGAALSGVFTAL